MDNFGTNQTNPGSPVPGNKSAKSSLGPTIGLIIILAMIIIGSLYFFVNDNGTLRPTSDEPNVTDIERELGDLRNLDESDELSAIMADLEATNLDNLDAELDAAEQELSEL